ncbi:MFS transporter [Pengzhenrongella sicca]|uniref:MFS transporter n=1 Tax=Pengzhenrongella sicca TaxID=2819238 RepID=A0A8A4ZF39_9MICO|nr:MFS transporter [Pengzhenrongella sicca]QTE29107.1 MFS transporter [Pengzhenrongella sicca]
MTAQRPAGSPAAAASPPVDRTARTASVAVFAVFVLNGFTFANWASRIPAVRDELELSAAEVGVLLLIGSIGSLLALPLAGLVVQRLGARRTVAAFAVTSTSGLLIAAAAVEAGQLVVVGVGLVLFGAGTGVWDASMNLEGAAVEQRLGRAIMPRFHAGFSVGTMAGAGVGALAAYLDATILGHLAIALSASLLAVFWAVRWFLPESAVHLPGAPSAASATAPAASAASAGPAGARGQARHAFGAWLEPRTLLIGLVVLGAALTEGAANDWVGLAVVDGFDQSHTAGALTFGLFVTAMTGMRFLGTGLLDRFGRVAVLRLCALLSIVGLLVFGLVPSLPLALVGVVLWGAGAALGFPVGMSAASDDPLRAAARVSVVSTIGYTAFLAGPPLLGLLAGQVGYRHALLAIAVPVVVGLAVLGALAPLPTAAGTRRPADRPA